MLPFINKNPRRVFIFTTIILAAILLACYYGASGFLKDNKPLQDQETGVVVDGKTKVTDKTLLVQKILYLKCNDEEITRSTPPQSLIGLNVYQVKKMYTGWNIDKFNAEALEMSLKVEGYCKEHSNNIFIGVKDGFVAVYYGKPGPKAIVKEVTNISVNHLSPEDKAELQKGITVESREDLLRTLEGMQAR